MYLCNTVVFNNHHLTNFSIGVIMIKKQLYGITVLRFIAAFYVFVFHFNIRERITDNNILNGFFSNGAIGMSIFFVLSGFILTYNYSSGVTSNYLLKRIARIYPAYLFMGLLSVPFLAYEKPITAITSLAIFLVPVQAWFYQSFPIWNFGGSWSVSVELFFYILFPFILPMVTKNNKLIVLIAALILSSMIIPVAKLLGGVYTFPVYYITPIYRLPEFVFGIALGRYFIDGVDVKARYVIISAIICIPFTFMVNPGYMFWNIFILPFIGILMIKLGRLNLSKKTVAIPFIYLGEISYSFYLMQLPLLLALDKGFVKLSGNIILDISVLFVANLSLASISYHFIENNKTIKSSILSRS